jgi:uncharacterized membrane protein YeiH
MLYQSTFLYVQNLLEIIGILAFAISGMMAGFKRQMDIVGIAMVSGLTAFGGGTLRDILLDRRPLFWFEHSYWLLVIIAMVIVAVWFVRNKHVDYTLRMIEVPDAVGLALFTILRIQVAAQQNLPWLVTILMGVISATFGGVLRDIVCGEKPQLFFDHKPYAVIAFLGGLLYVGLMTLTNVSYTSEVVTFAVIVFLRLFSLYRGWSLFKPKL